MFWAKTFNWKTCSEQQDICDLSRIVHSLFMVLWNIKWSCFLKFQLSPFEAKHFYSILTGFTCYRANEYPLLSSQLYLSWQTLLCCFTLSLFLASSMSSLSPWAGISHRVSAGFTSTESSRTCSLQTLDITIRHFLLSVRHIDILITQ